MTNRREQSASAADDDQQEWIADLGSSEWDRREDLAVLKTRKGDSLDGVEQQPKKESTFAASPAQFSATEQRGSPRSSGETPQLFPMILHQMLEEANSEHNDHIVGWEPDGLSFKVHKPNELAETIMPRYFKNQTQFRSFQRQLYLYQFSRVQAGPGKGGYIHPKFSKQNKKLCREMTPLKKTKPISGLQDSRQQPTSKAAPGFAKPAAASTSLLSSTVVVTSLPSCGLSSPGAEEQQENHRRQRGRRPLEPFFFQRQGTDKNIDSASRRLSPHQEQYQPSSRFSYPLGFDLEPTPIWEPPAMQHQILLSASSSWPLLQNASLSLQGDPSASSQESGPLLGWSISEQEQQRIFHDQLRRHDGHQDAAGGGFLLTADNTNEPSLAFSSSNIVPGGGSE